MTPEYLATLQQCVADGWPLIQIKRTHGTCWKTMRRHFPDYRGMPKPEAARLGAAARRATLNQRKRTP